MRAPLGGLVDTTETRKVITTKIKHGEEKKGGPSGPKQAVVP